MKKNEFIYEISHDVNKLKLFFYKMYLPYSYRKFGNLAVCANFYAIRHLFDRGSKLMLIKLNDKYVSGSLLFMRHNTLFGTHAGVIDNNIDYLKKGAATANYYFSMIWAKEIGAKFIDFGTCKPFLNDGILQYKKKWGVFIRKAESSFGIFAFKILNHSIGIDSFLLNNPFINLNNGRIEGVIVFKKDDLIGKPLEMIYAPESKEKMKNVLKKWSKTGKIRNEELTIISKFLIITFDEFIMICPLFGMSIIGYGFEFPISCMLFSISNDSLYFP